MNGAAAAIGSPNFFRDINVFPKISQSERDSINNGEKATTYITARIIEEYIGNQFGMVDAEDLLLCFYRRITPLSSNTERVKAYIVYQNMVDRDKDYGKKLATIVEEHRE